MRNLGAVAHFAQLVAVYHKGPHCVDFGFVGTTNDHFDIARRQPVEQGLIDRD
jgi:hypothetical protein